MPTHPGSLMLECQFALKLNQQEFAALLGRDRRTVQRWQQTGMALDLVQAETLANALRPTRPDLADQIVELGKQHAELAGLARPVTPASQEVIATILEAAAASSGVSVEAIRPGVMAAFEKAAEGGVDVEEVVAGLSADR